MASKNACRGTKEKAYYICKLVKDRGHSSMMKGKINFSHVSNKCLSLHGDYVKKLRNVVILIFSNNKVSCDLQ